MDSANIRKILITSSVTADRLLIKEILSNKYETLEAENMTEALDLLRLHDSVSLMILGMQADSAESFRILRDLNNIPNIKKPPVLAVIEYGEHSTQKAAFDLGATDIVFKPIQEQILSRRVQNIIQSAEIDSIARENELYAKELKYAGFDEQTGLFNQLSFSMCARSVINTNLGTDYVLVRMDIDRFKAYNDSFGISEGDKLLHEFGSLLSSFSTDDIIFGRLYADHFVSVMPKGAETDIMEKINLWLPTYPTNFLLSVSVGVFEINNRNTEISLMCDRALLALRKVKDSYTNKISYYTEQMRAEMLEEQSLTSSMETALSEGQFAVYFQPQFNYDTGCIIGAEALVRWIHPEKGIIPPSKFIPLFEKNGFISKLDEFVWEQSCIYLKKWTESDEYNIPFTISVNISRVDIYDKNLGTKLINLVNKYELDPSRLHLEITEGIYMSDYELLISSVKEFKQLGFTVEMDDFGSGYSTLNMLKDVPVDIIKLDMRFLSSSNDESRGGNILSSVIRMAHWLKIPVIAEGVDSKVQADYLKSLGASYMQGYLFGKPMSADSFEEFLSSVVTQPCDKYNGVNIDGMAAFWDAGAQNTLLFNSFVGGAMIVECYNGALEAIRVNDNFFKIVGATRDEYEIYQNDLISHIAPEHLGACISAVNEALETGEEKGCELRYKTLSGRPLWLSVRGKVLAHSADRAILYLSIENITERKLLEEQVKKATGETYALIQNTPGGIMKMHKDNGCEAKVEYISGVILESLGFDESSVPEIIKADPLCTIIPEDKELVRNAYHKAFENCEGFSLQFRSAAAGGKIVWVGASVTAMHENNGVSLYCSYADVTDIKQMSLQIENEKLELQSIINTIPGGVSSFEIENDSLKLVFCSDGILQLTGLTKQEYEFAINNKMNPHVFPADIDTVTKAFRNAEINGNGEVTFRLIRPNDNSVVWVNLRADIIYKTDDLPIVNIVFHNISKSLELYQDILDESSTIAVVQDISSHEILYYNASATKLVEEGEAFVTSLDFIIGNTSIYEVCAIDQIEKGKIINIIENEKRYTISYQQVAWNGHDTTIHYINDTTDTWLLEEIASDDNKRMQAVIENIASGVAVFGTDFKGEFVSLMTNKAFSELFEISDFDVETIHVKMAEKIHPDDIKQTVQQIKESIANNSQQGSEIFRVIKSDGSGYKWIYMIIKSISSGPEDNGTVFATYTDITEIKEMEQRVVLEKGIVETAIDASELAMWTVDLKSEHLIAGNELALKFAVNTGIGDSYSKVIESGVILPDSINEGIDIYTAIKNGAPTSNGIIHVNEKLVGMEWADVSYTSFENETTGQKLCVCIARDITNTVRKQKQYEQELEFQKMNRSSDLISSCCVNISNNKIEESFLYGSEEKAAEGITFDALINQFSANADYEETRLFFETKLDRNNLIEEYKSGNNSMEFEIKYSRRNTKLNWLKIVIKLFQDNITNDIKAFFYAYSISGQKMSEQIINKVLDFGYESLAIINHKKRKIYTLSSRTHNFDSQRSWEYPELLEKLVDTYVISGQKTKAMERMNLQTIIENLEEKPFYGFAVSEMINGEKRRLEYQFTYLDETKESIVAVSSDVTLLFMEQEKQNEKLQLALKDAEKANASKSEFLSRMSREIKTPIEAIVNLANSAKLDVSDSNKTKQNLHEIASTSKILNILVNDIMDANIIEQGKLDLSPTLCSTEELIHFGNTVLSPLCKQYDSEIIMTHANYKGPIYVDMPRLQQVLINLVSNAAKFSPRGSQVNYTSYFENAGVPGYINCVFIIQDLGIGMSPEFQAQMFAPFSQEKVMNDSKAGGLGLGLTICKNIISSMNGDLNISSQPGQGTTATVILCLPTGSNKPIQNEKMIGISQEGDLPLDGKNILIACSDELNIRTESSILKHEGANIYYAYNGKSCIERFSTSEINFFDIILIDTELSGIGGSAVARTIRLSERADSKTIPIIAISPNSLTEDKFSTALSGMSAQIVRPIKPTVLLDTVISLVSKDTAE